MFGVCHLFDRVAVAFALEHLGCGQCGVKRTHVPIAGGVAVVRLAPSFAVLVATVGIFRAHTFNGSASAPHSKALPQVSFKDIGQCGSVRSEISKARGYFLHVGALIQHFLQLIKQRLVVSFQLLPFLLIIPLFPIGAAVHTGCPHALLRLLLFRRIDRHSKGMKTSQRGSPRRAFEHIIIPCGNRDAQKFVHETLIHPEPRQGQQFPNDLHAVKRQILVRQRAFKLRYGQSFARSVVGVHDRRH